MLLGEICTRGCRFCAVATRKEGTPVDVDEPRKVAEAAASMKLEYVVITSVDRDDLPDGGAEHFARTISEVRAISGGKIMVEVLTPDFNGNRDAIACVLAARPAVFAHNLETVRRLTPKIRDPRCNFEQSLSVLSASKQIAPDVISKSSLMLGLGETEPEIIEAMEALRAANVNILTLGQYLQPSAKHVPVVEYIAPERFEALGQIGRKLGFSFVASGPLVRSSYRAGELFVRNFVRQRESAISENTYSSDLFRL
jgi:lipoic acid synthetase